MVIGYARVSTQDQNLSRQLDRLKREGCERIYEEKAGGGKIDRPELSRALDALRKGDVLMVTELARLSRSVRDLIAITDKVKATGADLRSLKESWADTTTPQGRLLFVIFAGLGEFERDLIRERTLEGLAAARARGRKGGHPTLDPKAVELALKMYDSKACTVAEITRATGVSKSALYAYLKDRRR